MWRRPELLYRVGCEWNVQVGSRNSRAHELCGGSSPNTSSAAYDSALALGNAVDGATAVNRAAILHWNAARKPLPLPLPLNASAPAPISRTKSPPEASKWPPERQLALSEWRRVAMLDGELVRRALDDHQQPNSYAHNASSAGASDDLCARLRSETHRPLRTHLFYFGGDSVSSRFGTL